MATWLSGISRQHRIIRHNAFVWCGVFLALFALMILRLFWLQVVHGNHYRKIADRYHTRTTVLPAVRGRILDRNLAVLALDNKAWSLFADPTLVTHPRFFSRQIAPVLGQNDEEVYAALTRRVPFIWIKRDITSSTADEVRRLALPGVQVQADGPRYRVGIRSPQPLAADEMARLAKALTVSPETLTARLGAGTRSGTRWLRGTYTSAQKAAAEQLDLPGLVTNKSGANYSVGVDPREYSEGAPRMPASEAAQKLAPVLGTPADAIERRLLYRPRYSPLKLMVSEQLYRKLVEMQGTVYVVSPGKLLDDNSESAKVLERFEESIDRLYAMLNEPEQPETISKSTIRARLSPGAAPGPLAVRLVKGRPSTRIAQRLLSRPIPGVVYGMPGIGMQLQQRRYYPYGALASPLLGFVGFVNDRKQGVFGLELSQEATLKGIDGREKMEIDAHHRPIPERIYEHIEPIDGRDVVLTLDLGIQQVAEVELAKAVSAAKALRGECIVMDPNNGDILAMASIPSWDANMPGKSRVPLANPTISNYYEPGSTFKTITVMAALEEEVVRDKQTVTYCSGAMPIGRRTIGEAHNAHGTVDCGRLLEQSCNIGAAVLALKLKPDAFMKWCKTLGFGSPTGLELANESYGSLNERNVDAKITLANMGFGQSLAVTAPQMTAAYSVVANGGEWVQPHLVKSRMLPDGTIENFEAPRRRVCSEETARLLRGYLERVVTKGTGGSAAIPGYRVGGKTGTAQKAGPGGYRSGKAIGSFIAIMPVEKPRLTIICVIDEPQGSHYGGVVAAPVVREVGRRALQYLGVPPSVTEPTTPQP